MDLLGSYQVMLGEALSTAAAEAVAGLRPARIGAGTGHSTMGMQRRELGDDGIAVNTITPDYIPHDKDYASAQWEGLNAWIEGDRCFKREQVPEDMVGTLLYLASAQSDFVSGQNIRVNGGRRFA